jgi:hypothetical protein
MYLGYRVTYLMKKISHEMDSDDKRPRTRPFVDSNV